MTNCINCGAPLKTNCDYCGTNYGFRGTNLKLSESENRKLVASQVKTVDLPGYFCLEGSVDEKSVSLWNVPGAMIPVRRDYFNVLKYVGHIVKC